MDRANRLLGVRLATAPEAGPLCLGWEDGHLRAPDVAAAAGDREWAAQGGWILPGLVDLHCDAIERVVEPRPGVCFELDHSLRLIDRRLLGSGITTIYHAISLAGQELGLRSPSIAERLVRAIARGDPQRRVRHRVHLRFEVTHVESVPLARRLIEEGLVSLLSFMDHTPGQGQFSDDEAYLRYLMLTYGRTERQARALLREKQEVGAASAEALAALAAVARQAGIPLAAHDLDDPAQVQAVRALGATLSEFPVNLRTARACRERGLFTLFGSPNVVRGVSSGQGMRATDAVEAGVADALCSDYAPETLLPALGQLVAMPGIRGPLACQLGSTRPAAMVGDPRAAGLAAGAPADFILVDDWPARPRVRAVWVGGRLQAWWP